MITGDPPDRDVDADADADPAVVRRLTEVDLGPGFGRPVAPDDPVAIAALHRLSQAIGAADDPDLPARSEATTTGLVRFGWDLEPSTFWLYRPDPASAPVAVLQLDLLDPPNESIAFLDVSVHPDHRRRGHGTAVFEAALGLLPAAVRTVISGGADRPATTGFLHRHGFRLGSTEVPHVQRLDRVDRDRIDRLETAAMAASAGYRTERQTGPTPTELLPELLRVAAAVEDAPVSGDLTRTSFAHDAERLRKIETAALLTGRRQHRVLARIGGTGEIVGHTVVTVGAERVTASQDDTAVLATHRGHRLGIRMKIDMMRWLRSEYPALQRIQTVTDTANQHMIAINEALGYTAGPTMVSYELTVGS